MLSLMERQVSALRESVRPGGRWDRLASGEILPDEDVDPCALCNIAPGCDACPLSIDGQECDTDDENTYDQWSNAVDAILDNDDSDDDDDDDVMAVFNSPSVVALAREMKALLERLLTEYEVRLASECVAAATDSSGDSLFGYPVVESEDAPAIGDVVMRAPTQEEARLLAERAGVRAHDTITGREPCCDRVPGPEDIPDETGASARDRAADEKWTCPHCGGTKGTWFDRTVSEDGSMADVCEDCGKDVGESPEHYARADALAQAHDALVAHLEEMSDVGAECAPLVTAAYRKWRELRDA